jgi:histidinol-phosphate aminotransferase
MDLDKLAKSFLQGIQPYKPGKPIEQLRRERNIAGPIAKLASNENPYPPLPAIRRAVAEAMDSANRYPESGAPELTDRLAAFHHVKPAEVFVANGTNEILDLLVRAYVWPEENCVFSQLSFVIYKLICMQCGVRFTEVPCVNYTHDLPAMAKAIDAKTKLVFVCNPNNPTGTYNTAAEIEAFLGSLPDHALLVLDEAYHEFANARDYPNGLDLRKKKENVVVLRTFSKFYSLAGIRLGYAIADPRVIGILHKMRQPFNVNRLAQAAAAAALECRDELSPLVEETIRERDTVRRELIALGCSCPPTQANFLFVIPPPAYSGDLCKRLEADGIIVRPMAPFGAPENAFRVSMGTPEENRRFLDAFKAALARRR